MSRPIRSFAVVAPLLPHYPSHAPQFEPKMLAEARLRVAEDRAVTLLAAGLGVTADDPALQPVQCPPTAAAIRHALRAAFRQGWEAK